ncbi:retrotransposable element Tf2 [Tanacetum coccineum]
MFKGRFKWGRFRLYSEEGLSDEDDEGEECLECVEDVNNHLLGRRNQQMIKRMFRGEYGVGIIKSSSTSDIQYLLNEYQDIFQDPKGMPPFRKGFNHKILLKEGSNPINLRPYRGSFKPAIVLLLLLWCWLKRRMEDGGWRMCVDYRSLNKSTISDRFPIPMVEELLDELHGYYRRFVKNYGNLARPLTQFLKKDAFKWSEEAEHAFQELKEVMSTPSVLALPDFNATFTIKADALGQGIRAILMQSVVDALSRITGGELLQLTLEVIHFNLWSLIKKVCEEDNGMQKFISELSQNPKSHLMYSWKNQELKRKGKLVIGSSTSLKKKILNWMHGSFQVAHSGCTVCQQCKAVLAASLGLLQPLPIPKAIWEDISMDFIEGLPLSVSKSVIIVVVDRLSKYGHFIAVKHPFTTVDIAQILLDHIFKLHGFLKSIVSDRDKVFFSNF